MSLKICIFCGLSLFGGYLYGQGKVTIIAEDAVVQAENQRMQKRNNDDHEVMGYRIFIGMFPTRSQALEFKVQADEKLLPDYESQVIYDEPNFKIYVGQYPSNTEADAAYADVKKLFHNAKKIRMSIKIKKNQ